VVGLNIIVDFSVFKDSLTLSLKGFRIEQEVTIMSHFPDVTEAYRLLDNPLIVSLSLPLHAFPEPLLKEVTLVLLDQPVNELALELDSEALSTSQAGVGMRAQFKFLKILGVGKHPVATDVDFQVTRTTLEHLIIRLLTFLWPELLAYGTIHIVLSLLITG